jgi:transglutaminase superfamily protein
MTTRSSGILRRLRHLDAERRALLVRAATVLAGASAAVAVLPFDRAIRFGSISRGCPRDLDAAKYVGAVETAAKYLPMRTMCIEKGLAAQRLLRRAGADARLHYGARHHPQTGKLEAHVWVSVDGANVIGGEEAADFAEVAVYA